MAIVMQMSRQESRSSAGPDHVTLPALITWLIILCSRNSSCTHHVSIMHCSRGSSWNDHAREVIAAYPDNHDAEYSLGLLLVEMGKSQEAVKWLARAARGMPHHARAHYNLGLLFQQLGRLDEAAQALDAAVQAEPANPDFLLALGDHYLRRGRAREALALAERLIAAAPEQPVGQQLKAA